MLSAAERSRARAPSRGGVLRCAVLSARRFLLALAAGSVGCLAPPGMQVATGLAARTGAPPHTPVDSPGELRVGLYPAQLFRSLTNRNADFGAGYLLDYGKVGPKRLLEGGYAEGSYVFLQGKDKGYGFGRLSMRGQGRMLVDGDGEIGGGGALLLTGEWAGFLSFAGVASNAAGAMWGEGSIGFYLEGAYADVATTPIWTAGLGLIVRTPATAFIAAAK
jgi:hypothetical protein